MLSRVGNRANDVGANILHFVMAGVSSVYNCSHAFKPAELNMNSDTTYYLVLAAWAFAETDHGDFIGGTGRGGVERLANDDRRIFLPCFQGVVGRECRLSNKNGV